MYNTMYIDEKWFYKTKGSQNYYLANEEEEPYRSCQSKHYIDKSLASVFLQIEAPAPASGDTTGDTPLGLTRQRTQHQKRAAAERQPYCHQV
jgi:hypothetical protein